MRTESLTTSENVTLPDARNAMPTTVGELARVHGASNRAAKRALQWLVFLGHASRNADGVFSLTPKGRQAS